MTLQIKIGRIKVNAYWFGSTKWFWPNVFVQFVEASKRHNKA